MVTFTIAGRLTEAGTVEARPIPSNAKDPDTGAGLSPVSAVASPAFSIQVPSVPGVKWQVSGINRVGKAGSRIVLRDTNTGLSLWVPAAPVINGGGGGGGGGGGAAPDLSGYLTKAEAANSYATKSDLGNVQSKPGPRGEKGEQGEPGQPGARGERGPEGPAGRDGTPADLSAYATKEDLEGTAGKAEEALVKARAAAYPFDNGGRYFSPVTYYWPDYYNAGQAGKTSKWADTLTMGNSLGIVILNRNSGDWSTFDQDFKTQGELALAAGAKRVVFYVKTQYGVASLPPSDPARAGVPNPDKFTEAYILDMVRKAKSQYGALCQGVFLDEFINGHGDQAGRIPWYRELVRKIREEHGADFLIVGNSGSNIADDVVALSDVDVFMMFEKDAKQFLVEDQNAPIFTPRMKQEPSTRWWIVVHGVSKANYQQVFDKAASLPVSHLYLTDGVLVEDPERGGQWEPVGNPYANPPSKPFMSLASKWVRGVLDLALGLDSTTARVDALEKKPGGGPAPDLTGYLKEEAADAKYAPKADGTKGKEAWDALVALNMKLGGLGTSTLADNLSSRITRLDQTGRYANEAKTRVDLLEPKVAAVETEFREIGTTLGADARHPLKDVLYQMQQEAGNAHAALQGLNGEITALKAELAKRAQVLVLGLDDPVPPGTPADTVIVRRQK